MTAEALALDIEVLSEAEAADIWKRASRRAENYAEYLAFMNARKVGETFRTKVPHGNKNAEHAKEIRYNFNEAASERTVDGKPAPVVLRWKTTTRTEQKTVQENGKSGKVEVKVIDLVTALVVDPTTIKARAKRPPTEVVDLAALGVTPAADAKTVALPDGRAAKRTKAGKWRAPKVAEQPTTPPVEQPSENGTTEKVTAAA